jgi:predicted dienelactone hydrolase
LVRNRGRGGDLRFPLEAMRRLLIVLALCLSATAAQSAGFRFIEVPGAAGASELKGAIWYRCAEPPGSIEVAGVSIAGVKDCPLRGDNLPLIVMSHGLGGSFWNLHGIAAALADAGFVVAAITHPDASRRRDSSTAGSLAWMTERPSDIRRLIDFALGASPASTIAASASTVSRPAATPGSC